MLMEKIPVQAIAPPSFLEIEPLPLEEINQRHKRGSYLRRSSLHSFIGVPDSSDRSENATSFLFRTARRSLPESLKSIFAGQFGFSSEPFT